MKLDHSFDSLEFVCKAVAKVLPSIGIDKSCISGTLFLIDALHEAGFTMAYALATSVCIENAARVDWVCEFGEPINEAMIEACNAAGGLTVNVGMANASEVEPDQWAGHLVAIIPAAPGARNYLIDLTIIQINDHGAFKLPPILAKVGAAFLEGIEVFKCPVRGCSVSYLARPNDLSFMEGRDLTLDKQRTDYISNLVKLLRSM